MAQRSTQKLVTVAHSVYSPRQFCLAIISLKLREMGKVSSFSFHLQQWHDSEFKSFNISAQDKFGTEWAPVWDYCRSCWPAHEFLARPSLQKQPSSLLAAWRNLRRRARRDGCFRRLSLVTCLFWQQNIRWKKILVLLKRNGVKIFLFSGHLFTCSVKMTGKPKVSSDKWSSQPDIVRWPVVMGFWALFIISNVPSQMTSEERVRKIQYWWSVATKIWVLLLIGRAAWEIWSNQSEELPRSG